ncbi:MAG: L,D-transpeptidase [Gemmatimonadaceae bacterium]
MRRHTLDAPAATFGRRRRSRLGALVPTLFAAALAACATLGAQVAPSDTTRDTTRYAPRVDSVRVTGTRPDSAAGDTVRPESAGALAAPARRSFAESPATLRASLSTRQIDVIQDGQVVKTYRVAVGRDAHPTPRGSFRVRRIVWNPSWHPPDEKWARGKSPKGPGHPANPMKVVKIFFREPDYYIHGTGDVESLGSAASHGCLRMDPDEAAELAQMVMESGGSSFGWDAIRRWLRLGSTRAVTLKRPVTLEISA